MELKLDPEFINQFIAEEVMKSALGQTVLPLMRQQLASWDFKRVVEESIKKIVTDAARKYIENDKDFLAEVEAKIKEHMTKEVMDNIVSNAVYAITSKKY